MGVNNIIVKLIDILYYYFYCAAGFRRKVSAERISIGASLYYNMFLLPIWIGCFFILRKFILSRFGLSLPKTSITCGLIIFYGVIYLKFDRKNKYAAIIDYYRRNGKAFTSQDSLAGYLLIFSPYILFILFILFTKRNPYF